MSCGGEGKHEEREQKQQGIDQLGLQAAGLSGSAWQARGFLRADGNSSFGSGTVHKGHFNPFCWPMGSWLVPLSAGGWLSSARARGWSAGCLEQGGSETPGLNKSLLLPGHGAGEGLWASCPRLCGENWEGIEILPCSQRPLSQNQPCRVLKRSTPAQIRSVSGKQQWGELGRVSSSRFMVRKGFFRATPRL